MSVNRNVNHLLTALGILTTVIVSVWAILKYLILDHYRIDNDLSKRLIARIRKSESFEWIFSQDHVQEPKFPDIYQSFVVMGGVPFFLDRGERLLNAGWKSKENVSFVIFPRWLRRRMNDILEGKDSEDRTIPIMAMLPSNPDRLGELIAEPSPDIFLPESLYQDIEEDVKLVLSGQKRKTSALLYGAPGNGKSQFVKYLSKKYELPIYIVYLTPEYTNLDIALMFSGIPQRSIVLMEDFDNYFNGRECILKNDSIKFSFDSIINSLDGVHNDYNQVIFILTANNIENIDESIKNRPSRFRYVREVPPPNREIRLRILKNDILVDLTEGYSLDKVFSYVGKVNNVSNLND